MSRRVRGLGVCFVASVLLVGAGAVEVAIVEPEPGEALFGEVEVVAEVYPPAAPVTRVDFFLDGRFVGAVDAAPFRLVLDVGQANVEHQLLVVVNGPDGEAAEAVLTSSRIPSALEVEVELQQLYVTVEREGERILDLERDDFTVLEDGVVQRLITFERGDIPFTAAVLVDASSSMEGPRLRTALAGAEAFVQGMETFDEAKLVLFSDRLLHETPFSNLSSVLTVGLAGVVAEGGTALHDALYLALKRLEPREGRRVAILLTDGIDVDSVLDMGEVQRTAEITQALLYWIRLRDADPRARHFSSSWRDRKGHARQQELLEETIRGSGGRIVEVGRLAGVEAAFEAILRELREQYVLGYYPHGVSLGRGWHDVKLEVEGAEDADIRTLGRRLVKRPLLEGP